MARQCDIFWEFQNEFSAYAKNLEFWKCHFKKFAVLSCKLFQGSRRRQTADIKIGCPRSGHYVLNKLYFWVFWMFLIVIIKDKTPFQFEKNLEFMKNAENSIKYRILSSFWFFPVLLVDVRRWRPNFYESPLHVWLFFTY